MLRIPFFHRLNAACAIPRNGALFAAAALSLALLTCAFGVIVDRFNRTLDDVNENTVQRVETRLAQIQGDIEGLHAFFRASEWVEPEEFAIYCSELQKNHPFIGWTAWFPPHDAQGKHGSRPMIFPRIPSDSGTGFSVPRLPGITAASIDILIDTTTVYFFWALPGTDGILCIVAGRDRMLPQHDSRGPYREALMLCDENDPDGTPLLVRSDELPLPAIIPRFTRKASLRCFDRTWTYQAAYTLRLNPGDWSLILFALLLAAAGGFVAFHFLRFRADRAFRAELGVRTQQMELLGTIAAGVVHDFNNVLVGISGTASLIRDFIGGAEAETKKRLDQPLRLLERAANRGSEIVARLLTFARPDSAPRERLDLRGLLADVMALAKAAAGRSVTIYLKDDGRNVPAWVEGNPVQLEQVFMHLVLNAAHAMTIMRDDDEPQGGYCALGIEPYVPDRRFAKRYVLANTPASFWKVTVSDTGVGMDRKTIVRLFTPYFTTKPHDVASGLGLSTAFSIVKSHRGYIEVESEVGRGTTFSVYLPAVRGE